MKATGCDEVKGEPTPALSAQAGARGGPAGRRRSLVSFNANPLAPEKKTPGRSPTQNASLPQLNGHKFHAPVMIGELALAASDEIDSLVRDLNRTEGNEDKLQIVEQRKEGKLFTCAQILQIMETTPSVKTRIAMIEQLALQVKDPKACTDILATFRFAEEKRRVERAFKARDLEVTAQRVTPPKARSFAVRGRGRGPGRKPERSTLSGALTDLAVYAEEDDERGDLEEKDISS